MRNVVWVAANNEKDARKVGALFLSGDHHGIYSNGAPAEHRDDIGTTNLAKFRYLYRVVQEAGHRGKVRYLVDRFGSRPFRKGDAVNAFTSGRTGGVTFANGTVTACAERYDRPGYWTVTVDLGYKTLDFTVNGKGRDASGYLKRGQYKPS